MSPLEFWLEQFTAAWDPWLEQFTAAWDPWLEQFTAAWDPWLEQFTAAWDPWLEQFTEVWDPWLEKCTEVWESAGRTASRVTSKLSDPELILGEPRVLITVTLCVFVNLVYLTRPKEQQKYRILIVFTIVVSSYMFRRFNPSRLQNEVPEKPPEISSAQSEPSKSETKQSVSEMSLPPSLETKQTAMIVASSDGSLVTKQAVSEILLPSLETIVALLLERTVKAVLLNLNQVVGGTQTLEMKTPLNFFGKSFLITNPNHQRRDHLKKSHNSVLTELKDDEYLRKMLPATIIPHENQKWEFPHYHSTVVLGPEAERIGRRIPMLEMPLKTVPSPPYHQYSEFIIDLPKFYDYSSPMLWDLLKMVASSPNRNETTSTSLLLRKIRYRSKTEVEKGEYSEPQDPSDLGISRSNPKKISS